jgi:hypothetical protein
MRKSIALSLLALAVIVIVGCKSKETSDEPGTLKKITIAAGTPAKKVVELAGPPVSKTAGATADATVWTYENGTSVTIKGGKVLKTAAVWAPKKLMKKEE